MQYLFDALGKLLGNRRRQRAVNERLSRTFQCRCGAQVFFRNSQCLNCQRPLGYWPDEGQLVALDPGATADTWQAEGAAPPAKFCANRDTPAGCNWLLAADDAHAYCVACGLNHAIPLASDPDNARCWGLIEVAKRRLVSQLLALGLPVRSKVGDDPEHGLAFDFLRSPPEGPRVLTGHANGLITLNIEEADDARREAIRHALREPYRTLLGHFRHEVGHYYWDRLVRDGPWLESFRALFGDERTDYAEALKRNYEQGPPADWADRHIGAYAATHPWEDWAETWAHYLHVVDSLGTALGFGLDAADLESDIKPFTRDNLYAPDHPGAARFLELLNGWIEMTMVLNELARSLGQHDFYPFVMSRPVVAKLHFVHLVVEGARPAPAV
jgi:hypothetical protein